MDSQTAKILIGCAALFMFMAAIFAGAILYEYRQYRASRELDNRERQNSAVLAAPSPRGRNRPFRPEWSQWPGLTRKP